MSELLARTLTQALPLFARRWPDEMRERGLPDHPGINQQEIFGPLLVEAIRSGEYRPIAAALRGNRAAADINDPEMWARLALLSECVRTVYDDDPYDLPALLREMENVWETLIATLQRERAPRDIALSPIIDALNRAIGIVPFVTTGYEPGQIICTQKDRDPIFYCVRSGHVRLTEPLHDGRMVTLSILRAGGIFGTVDAEVQHGISADAMTHSDISLLHASQLPALMRIAPEVVHAITTSLAAQLRDARLLVVHALAHDASVRLIAILLALADAFGEMTSDGRTLIAYPTTHQDLADMIGANRVTVTRKLIDLQKAGLIAPERRNMLLVDLPGLAALQRA